MFQTVADSLGTVSYITDPFDDLVEEDHVDCWQVLFQMKQCTAYRDRHAVGFALDLLEFRLKERLHELPLVTRITHDRRHTVEPTGLDLQTLLLSNLSALNAAIARAAGQVAKQALLLLFSLVVLTISLFFAFRYGDDLTASDILSPETLVAAHRKLERDRIAVAVPCRTIMLACDDDLVEGLASFGFKKFNGAEEEGEVPLSPSVFYSVDGEIIDLIKTNEADQADDEDDDETADDGVSWHRPHPILVQNKGKGTMMLALTCFDFDELTKAVQYEFRANASRFRSMKGFEGRVQFTINTQTLALSRKDKHRLKDLARFLESQAKEIGLRAPDGTAIIVVYDFP